jgi:hypothetical protein
MRVLQAGLIPACAVVRGTEDAAIPSPNKEIRARDGKSNHRGIRQAVVSGEKDAATSPGKEVCIADGKSLYNLTIFPFV